MDILNINNISIDKYCRNQIENLFPTGLDNELDLIKIHMDESLERLSKCISAVKIWNSNQFDVLHSTQYCTFLYYLANTIWRRQEARSVCNKLFLLNKALNAIDCFYEINLPDIFFIGHSVGIVFAKAVYGNYFVIYQNSTVGKNHGVAPILEDGVIMYPNTSIVGNSHIRKGSIISLGVNVIDIDTQEGKIAYQGINGGLLFKSPKTNLLHNFFHLN